MIRARHYATGQPLEITVADGMITSIRATATTDVLPFVAPAFFDLQVNGCLGKNFCSPKLTVADVRAIVATCRGHGIGALCPTLITSGHAALLHGLGTIRAAAEEDGEMGRALPAIHLEGPFISPEDGPRGAHPREHVRLPDWDEFRKLQDAAGGRIRLVTLAPEREGALRLIEKLVEHRVVVAMGHTAATPQQIRDGIKAGARLSTHLGNGCHAMLPRHASYLWEQLAADELWASIISDGHHLPPSLVRCIFRVKTASRLVLTCDASSLAGLPPGRYAEWGQTMDILPEGKIVVTDSGFLAGSWAFTDACVGNVMRFAGATLGEAIDMATVQPRRLLGLPVPKLAEGEPADLLLLDPTALPDIRLLPMSG